MSTTAGKVVSSLEKIFSRHGYPVTIKSDGGPQFISEEFQAYCASINVKHHRVTARWAPANGEVERQNRSLLKRIQIAQAESKDWKQALTTYLLAYRSLPHNTTGVSPGELLFGRKMRTKIPDIAERELHMNIQVRDRDAEQKGKSKLYADERRGAKYSEVTVGDQVLLRQEKQNKLTTPFNPTPHTVVRKDGNSVVVQNPSGATYSRNTTHVKRYITQDSNQDSEARDGSMANTQQEPEPQGSETVKDTSSKTVHSEATIIDKVGVSPRPQRSRVMPKKYDEYIMKVDYR